MDGGLKNYGAVLARDVHQWSLWLREWLSTASKLAPLSDSSWIERRYGCESVTQDYIELYQAIINEKAQRPF